MKKKEAIEWAGKNIGAWPNGINWFIGTPPGGWYWACPRSTGVTTLRLDSEDEESVVATIIESEWVLECKRLRKEAASGIPSRELDSTILARRERHLLGNEPLLEPSKTVSIFPLGHKGEFVDQHTEAMYQAFKKRLCKDLLVTGCTIYENKT